MDLSRRSLLKVLPLVGAASVAPVLAVSPRMGELLRTVTAKDRFDHHLAEFQRAAAELDPALNRWNVGSFGNQLRITGFRIMGRYDGDGFYEFLHAAGTKYVDHVRLLKGELIDGLAAFALTRWPGPALVPSYLTVTEAWLVDRIGKKLS